MFTFENTILECTVAKEANENKTKRMALTMVNSSSVGITEGILIVGINRYCMHMDNVQG